jgi:hypothetical protein
MPISEQTKEGWKNKLKTIQDAYFLKGCIQLNSWEVEFVLSIEKTLQEDRELSFKQSSVLSKIYAKIG